MGILKSFLSLLFFFVLTLLLFSKPTYALAFDYEVNNEYKSGINYHAFLPKDQGNLAIPFKVGSKGSYKNFQFMVQQGYYVGRGYGFPASTPYFDPISLYPTAQYFEHIRMAILPTDSPTTEGYPNKPEYPYWQSYGHVTGSVATSANPQLLEPEVIKDSTRFKWLQFDLSSGAVLETDSWYWLILYSEATVETIEEWETVGIKISTGYSKGEESTNNFGVAKSWHSQILWNYLNTGDYFGFRIGKATPLPLDKTPVIIIPGIGGSEFRAAQAFQTDIRECGDSGSPPYNYLKDEVIWVNELKAADFACDDYFDVLKLKSDGVTSEYPLVTLNGTIYSGTYSKLIQSLEAQGYEQNKTLYVFPFDWRKDISLTGPLLHNLVTSIKNQTGAAKVDIVAHSMGGLVARNYIKDPSQAGNVRKLVTLGTPYLGSVEFLKAIMYGKRIGPEVLGKLQPLAVQSSEVKDIFQNMTGGFTLLPTEKYYQFYDGSDSQHPRPFNDGGDIDSNGVVGPLTYDQLKQLMTNKNYNTSLFNFAESFHNSLGNFNETNGVKITQVVGSGFETDAEFIEKYRINFAGIKIDTYHDIKKVNGDEAAPLYSASLNDTLRGTSLLNNENVFYTKIRHGQLPSHDPVLQLVKSTLNNDNSLPTGIQTTPFTLNGQQVSVHSPVEIHAYDSVGNHTGPTLDGNFETNIPGSSYDTLEDSKFIWLPEGTFTLKLQATDDGHFDLKIREYKDDINTETITYQEVPLTEETAGEIVINSNSVEPPVLQIDIDGNGSTETPVPASSALSLEENQDQTPPNSEIKATGTSGNNGWFTSEVQVTLEAKDENSGVLKTEFSLDSGATSSIYSGPFYISKEGINTLLVKSTDQAGNQEVPQSKSVKIDKTKPEVKISATPNTLWPPNRRKVKVKISGSATDSDSGIISKTFEVIDEYNKVEPGITDFGQIIKLESWRKVRDWDGRVYTIKVKVTDLVGNVSEAQTEVKVPYFKR